MRERKGRGSVEGAGVKAVDIRFCACTVHHISTHTCSSDMPGLPEKAMSTTLQQPTLRQTPRRLIMDPAWETGHNFAQNNKYSHACLLL